jgi:hypothetical protein
VSCARSVSSWQCSGRRRWRHCTAATPPSHLQSSAARSSKRSWPQQRRRTRRMRRRLPERCARHCFATPCCAAFDCCIGGRTLSRLLTALRALPLAGGGGRGSGGKGVGGGAADREAAQQPRSGASACGGEGQGLGGQAGPAGQCSQCCSAAGRGKRQLSVCLV